MICNHGYKKPARTDFYRKMPTEDSENETTRPSACSMPMPKHIPFPDFPIISELLNELIMFVFIITAAAMQFISIYRTIWWLPESYINHVVNFDLIDPFLIILITTLTARRLVYCLLLRSLELLQKRANISNQKHRLLRVALKYSFGSLILSILSFCVWKIYKRTTYFSLILLLYPLIVYLLIFGFNIEPFLRTQCEVTGTYFNGFPMHSCSSNPPSIRDEIEVLRDDFNLRCMQMIFTSIINAYYSGFIPCFFATSIYYNVVWATQHVFFVGLSCFTLCCAFLFPSKYSDILHRASLHLGYWSALDMADANNLMTATAVPWNKSVLFMHSSIIKHNGEYYRSLGPVTVALPGNNRHTRFYRLFQNPSLIYKVLATLQICITLSQIFLFYFAVEWHFILSISFIALTNQFTLFKIMRDYFITKRIYATENSISDKQLNALHTE